MLSARNEKVIGMSGSGVLLREKPASRVQRDWYQVKVAGINIKGDRKESGKSIAQGMKTLYKKCSEPPFRVNERLAPTSTPCILSTARSAVARLLLALSGCTLRIKVMLS